MHTGTTESATRHSLTFAGFSRKMPAETKVMEVREGVYTALKASVLLDRNPQK
jgi:hypothetical protein